MTTTVITQVLRSMEFDRLRMAAAAYLARYKGALAGAHRL